MTIETRTWMDAEVWASHPNRAGEWALPRATVAHATDAQCSVNSDTNTCDGCGVEHGAPCPECSGRGFHKVNCNQQEKP